MIFVLIGHIGKNDVPFGKWGRFFRGGNISLFIFEMLQILRCQDINVAIDVPLRERPLQNLNKYIVFELVAGFFCDFFNCLSF